MKYSKEQINEEAEYEYKRSVLMNAKESLRLDCIEGEAKVTIETWGYVELTECASEESAEKRVRAVKLASTDKALMTISPKGLYTTVKIRLRTDKAQEKEFHRQLAELFEEFDRQVDDVCFPGEWGFTDEDASE